MRMNTRIKTAAAKHRREKAEENSSERNSTQWEIKQSLMIQLDEFKAKCAELETENKELREAAIVYQALATCYRIGKTPSEALFTRLGKANNLLKGKGT